MYEQYSSMRQILLNDGRVTDLTSNIVVGYRREHDSYPVITIHRVGGNSFGKLGYQTSAAGSKERNVTSLFQIDIFHRDTIEDVEKIDDAIQKAIMSGTSTSVGARMQSNPSGWDETFQAYRITQTWMYNEIVSD